MTRWMERGQGRGRLIAVLLATLLLVSGWLGGSPSVVAQEGAAFDQIYQASDGAFLWGEMLVERAEPYREAPDGQRLARYYAKGRMEASQPGAGVEGVTYGRLVSELINGQLAAGDSRALLYAGADIPIVGDRDRAANPTAPPYRALRSLLARASSAVGRPVESVLLPAEGAGVTTAVVALQRDPALGQLATNAVFLNDVGRNVPGVFWSVLTAHGATGGRHLTWTALFGWPLTDAFWVRARQNGQPLDALVQPFERRLLIYLPAAPAGRQVVLGDVGRDYLAWRDGLVNVPLNLAPPPSSNGLAIPPVGEAGTTFLLAGGGFKDGEHVDAWIETEGGSWPVALRLRPGGIFLGRLRSTPVLSAPGDVRLVVQGTSGHVSVVQLRILPTDTFTPGAEAREPATVPAGRQASITPGVLSVGQVGTLRAEGFAPRETITAWVTTGLSRVIPYPLYVGTLRRAPGQSGVPSVTSNLRADANGRLTTGLPGPGVATPGIFAITLVGNTSGHTAIAYFRSRAGESWLVNYFYGATAESLSGADAAGPDLHLPLTTQPAVIEAVDVEQWTTDGGPWPVVGLPTARPAASQPRRMHLS